MSNHAKVIAVVDDDSTMLKAIQRVLSAYGFDTQVFSSAEAFLDSRAANEALCLVLDIHLRGISGIELGRRLKAVRSKLPVIFITATDDEVIHREAIELGGIACLRKPFSPDSLIGAINKATN